MLKFRGFGVVVNGAFAVGLQVGFKVGLRILAPSWVSSFGNGQAGEPAIVARFIDAVSPSSRIERVSVTGNLP
jgi:hypothetical protein